MTLFRKANIFILQPSNTTPRRKTFLLIVDVEMIFRFLPCRVGPFFDQEESQQFGEMAQPDHKTSNLQIKRHRRLRKLFPLRLQFSLQFSSTYTNCELELHLEKQIQYRYSKHQYQIFCKNAYCLVHTKREQFLEWWYMHLSIY